MEKRRNRTIAEPVAENASTNSSRVEKRECPWKKIRHCNFFKGSRFEKVLASLSYALLFFVAILSSAKSLSPLDTNLMIRCHLYVHYAPLKQNSSEKNDCFIAHSSRANIMHFYRVHHNNSVVGARRVVSPAVYRYGD